MSETNDGAGFICSECGLWRWPNQKHWHEWPSEQVLTAAPQPDCMALLERIAAAAEQIAIALGNLALAFSEAERATNTLADTCREAEGGD